MDTLFEARMVENVPAQVRPQGEEEQQPTQSKETLEKFVDHVLRTNPNIGARSVLKLVKQEFKEVGISESRVRKMVNRIRNAIENVEMKTPQKPAEMKSPPPAIRVEILGESTVVNVTTTPTFISQYKSSSFTSPRAINSLLMLSTPQRLDDDKEAQEVDYPTTLDAVDTPVSEKNILQARLRPNRRSKFIVEESNDMIDDEENDPEWKPLFERQINPVAENDDGDDLLTDLNAAIASELSRKEMEVSTCEESAAETEHEFIAEETNVKKESEIIDTVVRDEANQLLEEKVCVDTSEVSTQVIVEPQLATECHELDDDPSKEFQDHSEHADNQNTKVHEAFVANFVENLLQEAIAQAAVIESSDEKPGSYNASESQEDVESVEVSIDSKGLEAALCNEAAEEAELGGTVEIQTSLISDEVQLECATSLNDMIQFASSPAMLDACCMDQLMGYEDEVQIGITIANGKWLMSSAQASLEVLGDQFITHGEQGLQGAKAKLHNAKATTSEQIVEYTSSFSTKLVELKNLVVGAFTLPSWGSE